MIKVTYLDHSGFALVTPSAILVFDYCKDPEKNLEKLLRQHPDPELPVVFFVSHHHPDHFNTSIFELAQDRKRFYVLSNDIFSKLVPNKGISVAWMSAGDVIESIPGLARVETFRSTDAGVSFHVTLPGGKTLFHAGDLNDWRWASDSTAEEQQRMEQKFTAIIDRIKEEHPSIDIVMFPVDARLGDDFARGAQSFLMAVKTGYFFPMHFWGEPQKACDFDSYIPKGVSTKCVCLDRPGQHCAIEV